MNRHDLEAKLSTVTSLLLEKGHIAFVDVFMKLGYLPTKQRVRTFAMRFCTFRAECSLASFWHWLAQVRILALAGVFFTALVAVGEPTTETVHEKFAPIKLFPRQGKRYFRIPGLTVTRNGTLLAFAGERKGSIGDFGHDTDIVLRRNSDGGGSWTATETILSSEGIDFHSGPVVVDRQTGSIFKFARSHGAKSRPGTDWRENYILRSDDDGRTWSRSVMALQHPRASSRFGPGNGGHGIQLADGRLMIQGGYMRGSGTSKTMSLCLIESRDHGSTWQVTPGSDLDDAHVEFCIAETAPGRIYLNLRELRGTQRLFGVMDLAEPPGTELLPAPKLPGTRCCAGMAKVQQEGSTYLYCTTPTGAANRERYDRAARVDLALFRYELGGSRWERVMLVHQGKAAYSDLAVLPGGDLACVYESGKTRPEEEIHFRRISKSTYLPDGAETSDGSE